MKKALSLILVFAFVLGVFANVYTPVNAVETTEEISEVGTTVPAEDDELVSDDDKEPVTESVTEQTTGSVIVPVPVPTTESDTESEAESTTEPTTVPETESETESETETVLPEPAMPTGLKAEQAVEGVSLSWDAVEGATSYKVYRKAYGEEVVQVLAVVEKAEFIDAQAENGGMYEYSVSALIDATEGDACEGISAIYVATPKLRSAENKSNGVKVTWSKVDFVTGYVVYRKTANGSWKKLADGITDVSYVDTTAKSGTTYFYRVRAVSEDVMSSYDETGIKVMRLANPKIKSIENAVGGLTVKWGTVKGAQKYQVYRKNSGKWEKIATVTKATYTDKNVKNSRVYYYTVKAVNGDYISASEKGTSLRYVATPKLTSLKCSSDGLIIKWKAVSGAKSYRIYRYDSEDKRWEKLGSTTGTTYKDTKVVAYQSYKYSVKAVNGKTSAMDSKGLSKQFVPTGKWSKEVTYKFYKNAIDYAEEAEPKYTVKTWQNIDSSYATGKHNEFVSEFESIIESSFYPASDPLVYKCTKGSDDSEELLPDCDAKLKNIKSATATKSGKNIVVKFVMKDETSPEKNSGGIKSMSHNYFDLNGVVKLFKNEGLVTSGSSSSTYKNFTITATIKPNGKIVSMKHSCENISMNMNMNFINGIGNVKYRAQIDSYLTYTGFKY